MNYVEVTEQDLEKYVHIDTYRTRTRVHHINNLYYDPENKRFLRKLPRTEKWIQKVINPNRQTLIVYIGDNMLAMSYPELQKQYPEIQGLYDPSKPVRIRKNKALPVQEESLFDASSVVDSFLDSEDFSIF